MKAIYVITLTLMLGACGQPQPGNTAVFLLVDTSGTYTEELNKAHAATAAELNAKFAADAAPTHQRTHTHRAHGPGAASRRARAERVARRHVVEAREAAPRLPAVGQVPEDDGHVRRQEGPLRRARGAVRRAPRQAPRRVRLEGRPPPLVDGDAPRHGRAPLAVPAPQRQVELRRHEHEILVVRDVAPQRPDGVASEKAGRSGDEDLHGPTSTSV
mgnify:CR=1 FL=1